LDEYNDIAYGLLCVMTTSVYVKHGILIAVLGAHSPGRRKGFGVKPRKEKIVLVGLGSWGPNYLSAIDAIESMELVGGVDLDQARIDEFDSLGLGVLTGKNLEEVVGSSGATGAIVATPAKTHFRVASQLLSSGLHVLVEKPLGMTVDETSSLLKLAEDNKVTLYTGLNYMTHPCIQAIASMNERGVTLSHMQSERYNYGPRRSDVGITYDLLPHDISMAMAVFQSEPETVRGLGLERQEVSGSVSIEVVFKNGSTLICNLSWKHPKKIRNVSFSGGDSVILFDELARPGEEVLVKKFHETESSENLYSYSTISEQYVDVNPFCIDPDNISMRNQPLAISLSHFKRSIDKGEHVTFSARAGNSIVKILQELEEQIRETRGKGES
jgi:UDP-2-acetamido-3-amino-2,3-dideoxy-glucuronate N-acetyltransferase